MNKCFRHQLKGNNRSPVCTGQCVANMSINCDMAVKNKCDLRTYGRDTCCRVRKVMRLGNTQRTGQILSGVLHTNLAICSQERWIQQVQSK